jgi:hypothetical protein
MVDKSVPEHVAVGSDAEQDKQKKAEPPSSRWDTYRRHLTCVFVDGAMALDPMEAIKRFRKHPVFGSSSDEPVETGAEKDLASALMNMPDALDRTNAAEHLQKIVTENRIKARDNNPLARLLVAATEESSGREANENDHGGGVQNGDGSHQKNGELARMLAAAAILLDRSEVMDLIKSVLTKSLSKSRKANKHDAFYDWAAELVFRFRSSFRDNTAYAIYESKAGYDYVPGYYGECSKKLPLAWDVPVFGPLARQTIDEGKARLRYGRLHTLFTRLEALKRLYPAGGVNVVEVGVYRGGTTAFLARSLLALGLDGGGSAVFACDTFSGHSEEDVGDNHQDGAHYSGKFSDTSVEAVTELLSQFPFANVLHGRVEDVCDRFPENVGLVHLDTDLYSPTLFGLEFFYDRLVRGGAIVVDDYNTRTCPGVLQAVEEFIRDRPDAAMIPMLTGQCMILRTA